MVDFNQKYLEYKDLIDACCNHYRLDSNLIRAFISTESSWNPNATRYEPTYRWLFEARNLSDRLQIDYIDEVKAQSTSYGLMQAMGALMREYGYMGKWDDVQNPAIPLAYSCQRVRYLLNQYGDEEKVIASYNAGSPRYTDGGMFENQIYVDKVYSYLRELRALV